MPLTIKVGHRYVDRQGNIWLIKERVEIESGGQSLTKLRMGPLFLGEAQPPSLLNRIQSRQWFFIDGKWSFDPKSTSELDLVRAA